MRKECLPSLQVADADLDIDAHQFHVFFYDDRRLALSSINNCQLLQKLRTTE